MFTEQKDAVKWIQQYDINNKFDYTYRVKEEELIKNPLDGKSFFDLNHVFNPFTIGKAETRMSDATDSTITVINNR